MSTKAQLLWQILADNFGLEPLIKKFGDTPPPSWVEMVEAMPEYKLKRGVHRIKHSGMEFLPTLPGFVKLCEDMGRHDGDDYEVIGPDPDAPKIAPRAWGRWDMEANHQLWRYVRTYAALHPLRYTPEATRRLVAAKNAWAQDMAADDVGDGVPAGRQLETFLEVMASAEADIERMPRGTLAQREEVLRQGRPR